MSGLSASARVEAPNSDKELAIAKVPGTQFGQFWLFLVLIVLLAAILRLYALGDYPQIFDQDEAVVGYDAWSIWTTGKDQHGTPFPVHFRTFNDYVLTIANYIVAPFVGVFGLNEFTTRLPFALMGIAGVWLTGLIGRRWFGAMAGLVAALLLAVEPWHLNYSRVAQSVSCVTFFITASLYTFTRAITVSKTNLRLGISKQIKPGWFMLSAVCFALLTYSYPPLKVETPFLLAACGLAAAPLLWRQRWLTLAGVALYGLCITPLLLDQLGNWQNIQLHYNQLSIFDSQNWPSLIFGQYISHYNPLALFFDGYLGGRRILPPAIGELFWLEGLLWVAALIGLIQQRQFLKERLGFSLPILIAIWFVTFPIASSVTNSHVPNETRALNFMPLPELLAGFGAAFIWTKLSVYRWRKFTAAYGAALVGGLVLLVFSVLLISSYFDTPLLETDTPATKTPYNLGYRAVVEKVLQQVSPCDTIWLEPTNQAYIYYLFTARYPAQKFQEGSNSKAMRSGGWLYVYWFNQVHIGVPGRDKQDAPIPPECQGQPSRTFLLAHHEIPGKEWQEVAVVRNASGAPIWRAVVK